MTRTETGPHDVLVITLSNIGDVIMTTPVLESLHRLYPETRIDMVVDRRSSALLEHCPYRGELYIKDKKSLLRGAPGLIVRLRKNHYKMVIDLRTDGLAFFLRADRKLTKRNSDPKAGHAVEQHLSVLGTLPGEKRVTECCLWPSAEDLGYAGSLLGDNPDRRILCIAPGANSPGKIWSPDHYKELIALTGDQFACVLLLGSREDAGYANRVCMDNGRPIKNLCGKTTLMQAAAILGSASLFIGNDSGLGHMAAAMGTPTCTLFGPGNPGRYHPWGKQSIWLADNHGDINMIKPVDVITQLRNAGMIV